MHTRRTIEVLTLCLALGATARADAQSCADFTDVNTFNSFCQDIRWLKNRKITLGCTATEYCPDTEVSRLSMAAFMNRLGNVVTPTVLSAEDSGGTLDPALAHVLCQTSVLPARTHNSELIGSGALSFEVTGVKDVPVGIVFSTNGGTTWNPIGSNIDFPAHARGNVGSRQHAHVSTWTQYSVTPDIRYGLRVQPVSAAQSISSWTCQLQMTVFNGLGPT